MDNQTKTFGKKKSTALLLCIFTGWLGLHRFYMGRKISGVILVLMTASIILVFPFLMALFFIIALTIGPCISMMVAVVLGFYWWPIVIPSILIWIIVDIILILTNKLTDSNGNRLEGFKENI